MYHRKSWNVYYSGQFIFSEIPYRIYIVQKFVRPKRIKEKPPDVKEYHRR